MRFCTRLAMLLNVILKLYCFIQIVFQYKIYISFFILNQNNNKLLKEAPKQ